MIKLKEIRKAIKEAKNKTVDSLFITKIKAYRAIFNGEGSKVHAEIVLADLIKFSKADKSSYQPDLSIEEIALRAALKKPVLRILDFLKFSDEDIKRITNNINKDRK